MDKRREYRRGTLEMADLPACPFTALQEWMDTARAAAAVVDPGAMVVSTVGADGRPTARAVLLKGISADRGLFFYSDYRSEKARNLSASPFTEAVLLWTPLERQVRVRGPVNRMSTDASDAYWSSRPRSSQIAALASHQSAPLASRATLEERLAQLDKTLPSEPIPRPAWWGGFVIVPDRFEFWQGRPSRLNDRIIYRPGEQGQWRVSLLNP